MILNPTLARRFIASYKDFLSSLVSAEERRQAKAVAPMLVKGRDRWAADRSLLAQYRAQAEPPEGPGRDEEMLDAMAAARLGRWVYLKDTRSYSVLLDEQGETAYAVLGLTQPLRELYDGSSGLVFESALLPLGGHWVCDGLNAGPVVLGPNMRRDLNQRHAALRAQGRFSSAPGRGGV